MIKEYYFTINDCSQKCTVESMHAGHFLTNDCESTADNPDVTVTVIHVIKCRTNITFLKYFILLSVASLVHLIRQTPGFPLFKTLLMMNTVYTGKQMSPEYEDMKVHVHS